MSIRSFLLVVILAGPMGMLAQDEKSPDLQQQKHNQNDPAPQATQPDAHQSEPQAGGATGTASQGDTGADAKKSKKRHGKARHAHGATTTTR
jgi:hypothetical protein